MVKYKGNNVSRHRYNQLVKSKENFHILLDSMMPKFGVPRKMYDELVKGDIYLGRRFKRVNK